MQATAYAGTRGKSDRALDRLVWCALIAAVLVAAHPYVGIVHDGILYLAQALMHIYPDIYAGDLFFKWGSQDQYSIFSSLYSALIASLGLNGANVLLVVLSQGVFLGASFLVVRRLLPPGLHGFGLLMLACSNGIYGGQFIFRVAEPFVTPRPFAEAATLFAVALLVSGRKFSALAVLLGSALLHPLVALAGLLYAWIYLVMQDRRWAWALLLAVPGLAAGLAGMEPFVQLFRQFDPDWLATLVDRNPHIFLKQWTSHDWSLVACDLAIAAAAFTLADGLARRALGAVLVLAASTLALSFVGADLLHNVLLTNLQPWRGLWLVHWMSAAVLPFLAWRMWREGPIGQLVAGLAIYVFVFRGLPSGLAAAVLMALLFAGRGRLVVRERLARVVLVALAVGGMANWLGTLWRVRQDALATGSPVQEYVIQALSKPFVLLVLGCGIGLWLLRDPKRWQKAAVALALAMLTPFLWDQRSALARYVETTPMGTHPFSKIVSPRQEVFWYKDVVTPWVLMQRRSYMSGPQKAGQMFNRNTAMEFRSRSAALNIMEFHAEVCAWMNAANNRNDSCEPNLETLETTCREAKGLDFIVLRNRIGKHWVAYWTPPVELNYRRPYFYLYDCKKLVRG